MPDSLPKTFTVADILDGITSWEAYSATNLIYNQAGELLLGSRAAPGTSIPEPGDLALIGGFNTVVCPGPAMRAAVADAHAREQANLLIRPEQCSPFLECEYQMVDIAKPLNTSFGPLPIKRAAFDRLVFIDMAQLATVKVGGSKLKELMWYSRQRFEDETASGRISFPYQLQHVRDGFEFAAVGHLPTTVGWG